MVTITKHFQREDAEGNQYSMLELSGDIEVQISKASGRPYFLTRKCSIPAALPSEMCISLLGKQIPGNIKKIDCEAYDYTVPSTGEVIQLKHRFEFQPETSGATEEAVFGSLAKKSSIIKAGK